MSFLYLEKRKFDGELQYNTGRTNVGYFVSVRIRNQDTENPLISLNLLKGFYLTPLDGLTDDSVVAYQNRCVCNCNNIRKENRHSVANYKHFSYALIFVRIFGSVQFLQPYSPCVNFGRGVSAESSKLGGSLAT